MIPRLISPLSLSTILISCASPQNSLSQSDATDVAGGIPSISSPPICGIVPTTYANDLVRSLIETDNDNESEWEQGIEEDYKVQILHAVPNGNPFDLGHVYNGLQHVPRKHTEGLTILGSLDSPTIQAAGQFSATYLGPTLFFSDGMEDDGFFHEITHKIHRCHPQLSQFDQEWDAIPTMIYEDGTFHKVTTGHAIQRLADITLFDDELYDWVWNVEDKLYRFGIFGFMSPYGSLYHKAVAHPEDVATFGPFVFGKGVEFRDNLAVWDPAFQLEPYVAKVTLMEQYGFISNEDARNAKERLEVMFEDPGAKRVRILTVEEINTLANPRRFPVSPWRYSDSYMSATYTISDSLELAVDVYQGEDTNYDVEAYLTNKSGGLEYRAKYDGHKLRSVPIANPTFINHNNVRTAFMSVMSSSTWIDEYLSLLRELQ